jgi:ADP-ribose pyrophosphatase
MRSLYIVTSGPRINYGDAEFGTDYRGESGMEEDARRSLYRDIRQGRPELFVNPEGAPIEVLLDPSEVAEAERTVAADLAEGGLPTGWSATGVVYQDPYLMLLRDAVRMPFGLSTYVRAINAGNATGVVILPRFRDEVVLVRHFRHATRQWHLELPRGFGTPGSDVRDDARRELEEEIGVPPAKLESLGVIYPDTGMSATPVELFHAEIADPPRAAGADEGIVGVRLVTAAELAALIEDGTITDGFTIAAFTRAWLRGLLPLAR